MGRKPLYKNIYHRLRYQILSGEWPIGSPLPPERKLATELGVSRNTIVRALDELEAEGLIAGRMGSGRYVEPLPPAFSLSGDDWRERLHRETQAAPPSYMAEILSLRMPRPGTINFAHGDGGKQTLAGSEFSAYLKEMADRIESYYFLPIEGHPGLREWIVSWMGIPQISSPDQVVVTSGSQEALHLTTLLLAKPKDAIAVEMPTYFGALQLFQSLGMRIIPIPVDREGMRLDVLEGVLARYRPSLLYTVPTFHNPTGYTMSPERRRRLIRLSEQYGIPIVEDDAYRHLHLDQPAPPPLKSLDENGFVIYINTFSKILFPGLRLGWVAASRPFIQAFRRLKELGITSNTYGQYALVSFLRNGSLVPHLERARTMYRQQAEAMGRCLKRLTPLGIRFDEPGGGFYYWVSLPEDIDPRELLRECQARDVTFACGDMFLTREAIQPYIRLCFTHEATPQIEEGMSILGECLAKRKEMCR